MKNSITDRILFSVVLAFPLIMPSVSRAVPYACDITNNAGTVSFRLNENADNVKIVSNSGTITNDLGAGIKGLTVTNLAIASGNIKVIVLRSAPAGYTQSSIDGFQDNGVYVNKFEHPRGVVVNKSPVTPSFGRIYVSCARVGTTAGSFVRTTSDGIYLINSDDTVALDTGTNPRTAGIPFSTGTETASPLRLTIGKDDNQLYICDLSDPKGGLWVTDLDVTTGTNALAVIGDASQGATNHGSIYSAVVEGTLANSNLKIFTMDEDLVPVKSAWRYDVNGGPIPFAGPTNSLGQAMTNVLIDLAKGGSSNYLYASQNSPAGDAVGIRVFTADGITITNSLDASRAYLTNSSAADLLRNALALDLSPDGTTLAVLQGSSLSGRVLLVPLVNGLFNFAGTNSFSVANSSNNNRDLAYDAAGNIYVVSSSGEWLRIFSKGGATIATTGTDGTFNIAVPPLLVGVTATATNANEQGPVNGQFTITRSGDTSGSLTVNYTVGGTAAGGSDYTALPGLFTFLPGATSTNITVAVTDDAVAELTETVILTISSSPTYGISSGSATVSILDNEAPELSLTLAQSESRLLEGYAPSKVGFQVTRRGLVTSAMTANLAYSGTAAVGVRFNGPSTVSIGANVANVTFNLTPINDQTYQSNQTAIVSVAAGTGYAIGSTNSATATVIDDEAVPGTTLFTDNFETSSASQWIVNTVDGGADSHADFAYDYSQLFVPPAPGGSSTLGLRLRCNETTGNRNAISVSPLGLNLQGDYRLKFNMWINYNGPMFDGGAGSTFHMNAGVGTTADHANLDNFGFVDGIWFSVDGDGGSTFLAGDANAYIGADLQPDESGFYAAGTNNLPRSTASNPFYSLWGSIPAPAAQLTAYPSQSGTSQPGNMGVAWHTVVVTKATNAVTWVIDGITIATVPTATATLSTNVFVGYADQFAGTLSSVPVMSFAIVDNLRVETFVAAPPAAPRITSIRIVGSNVEINFTGAAADAPSSFAVQSAAVVTGTYADTAATITSPGAGVFQATFPINGATRFYRIRR